MKLDKFNLRHRSYLFSLDIINFIDNLPKDNSVKIMSNQLLRSATSIGANVTEAQASSSRKDFTNFFHIALKSANETKYWLALLRDSKKAKTEEINKLLNEVTELANILASSLLTLKGKK